MSRGGVHFWERGAVAMLCGAPKGWFTMHAEDVTCAKCREHLTPGTLAVTADEVMENYRRARLRKGAP